MEPDEWTLVVEEQLRRAYFSPIETKDLFAIAVPVAKGIVSALLV